MVLNAHPVRVLHHFRLHGASADRTHWSQTSDPYENVQSAGISHTRHHGTVQLQFGLLELSHASDIQVLQIGASVDRKHFDTEETARTVGFFGGDCNVRRTHRFHTGYVSHNFLLLLRLSTLDFIRTVIWFQSIHKCRRILMRMALAWYRRHYFSTQSLAMCRRRRCENTRRPMWKSFSIHMELDLCICWLYWRSPETWYPACDFVPRWVSFSANKHINSTVFHFLLRSIQYKRTVMHSCSAYRVIWAFNSYWR